jgi:endonuclease YncB( thermonuclease family)
VDGDTLACAQGRVRLRRVDTPERGESGYRAAQQELRRRTQGGSVTVVPHHRHRYG